MKKFFYFWSVKQIDIMKVTKIAKGLYKVVDSKGTWLAMGPNRSEGNYWIGYECDNESDCSNDTNWGVGFKTFAQLKRYSQSF